MPCWKSPSRKVSVEKHHFFPGEHYLGGRILDPTPGGIVVVTVESVTEKVIRSGRISYKLQKLLCRPFT